jgi:alkylation response protein AidB-like acyl-CoA dehydrogenase
MHFDLTDDQREIRDVARALLARRAGVEQVRAAAETACEDAPLWEEMVDLGWPAIAVPEAYGGHGLGLVELCVLLEEQGAALAPTPLLPTVCAAAIIARGGDAAQRVLWLPALAGGDARAAVGLAPAGSERVVVAGAAKPDVVVLVDERGARLLAGSEARIEPVEMIDPLRKYAIVSGDGEPLPGDVARGVQEATVAVAAELLGVGRRALELTLAYVKERRQFGVPVASFQAIGHMCAEMLLHVESARSSVYAAAWSADAAVERLAEASAIAKLTASECATAVSAAAIQAHGGVGFTWEAEILWFYKRAQLAAQLLGGPELHRRRLGELVAAV